MRRTIAGSGRADDPDAVVDAVEALVPTLERLQSYVWRRHLAVTAGRMLSVLARPEGERPEENRVVVGFADIVGFTALSRKIDETELRSLLERFETVCTDVVARRHGRIVKTLGDEILFVCERVEDAVDIAFRLHEQVPDEGDRLTLRVGLALGDVLPRYGDVYGPVVNIASRLTSEARPGHRPRRRGPHPRDPRDRARRRGPRGAPALGARLPPPAPARDPRARLTCRSERVSRCFYAHELPVDHRRDGGRGRTNGGFAATEAANPPFVRSRGADLRR